MVTANVDLTLGLGSPASWGIFWSKMGNGFQFMVIGNGYKRTNKGQFLTFPQYNSGKFTVTIEYMLIFWDIEYRATQ